MSFKDSMKSAASALGSAATIALDLPAYSRIREIDEEIEKLQDERQALKDRMINKMDI